MNEWEDYAARWLRNLFPNSVVDSRSIVDVMPAELMAYNRCHFFAGIGGWEYALEIAGWSASNPVWTGSCPCQPFSVAGKQLGEEDERHLWPEFFRLIRECRPPVVFGEQVAGQSGLGWLAGVRDDLESVGYAVGAADLPAACVTAPHKRQRLFWAAYCAEASNQDGRVKRGLREGPQVKLGRGGSSMCIRVADSGEDQLHDAVGRSSGEPERRRDNAQYRIRGRAAEPTRESAVAPWGRSVWIECTDGKFRRVPCSEQGILPLAPRVPGTVEQISAYGNAIVPQVAAMFIRSFMEAVGMVPTDDEYIRKPRMGEGFALVPLNQRRK